MELEKKKPLRESAELGNSEVQAVYARKEVRDREGKNWARTVRVG